MKAAGAAAAVHSTSTVNACECRECMLVLSSLLYSYAVQDALPRERCQPQGAALLASISIIKRIPHRHLQRPSPR